MKLIIAFLSALIASPWVASAVDAEFKAQCDNTGTVERSDNGGNSWNKIGDFGNWWQSLTLTLRNVKPQTRIQVTCIDQGVVGGFIGQITMNGKKYYTKNSIGPQWSVRDASGALVYTRKGTGAWGGNVDSGIDNNADWVWDGSIKNTIKFMFTFKDIVYDATFKGNCDNRGDLLVSDDGGKNWKKKKGMNEWNNWQVTLTETIRGVTEQTILRVVCEDYGVVGGFIGQVEVDGRTYATKSNSDWEASDYDGTLKYTPNGQGAWGGFASTIDSSAAWIWDGVVGSPSKPYSITFDFKFSSVLSSAPVSDYPPVNEEPPQYFDMPGKEAAAATATAAATAMTTSMYYLMMLTCALLFGNIALITYGKCQSSSLCRRGAAKYSAVGLYSDGEVAKMNNIEA